MILVLASLNAACSRALGSVTAKSALERCPRLASETSLLVLDPEELLLVVATCSFDRGAKVTGTFSPVEARALVTYREKHGDYREWGEMLVVYGVDGRKLEAAKEKMSF